MARPAIIGLFNAMATLSLSYPSQYVVPMPEATTAVQSASAMKAASIPRVKTTIPAPRSRRHHSTNS